MMAFLEDKAVKENQDHLDCEGNLRRVRAGRRDHRVEPDSEANSADQGDRGILASRGKLATTAIPDWSDRLGCPWMENKERPVFLEERERLAFPAALGSKA